MNFIKRVIKDTLDMESRFVIPLYVVCILVKGSLDYFNKGYLDWGYYWYLFINDALIGGICFFLLLSIIDVGYHQYKISKSR